VSVPDLDWPVDLFTDMIEVRPETIEVLAAVKPNLWSEMTKAWSDAGLNAGFIWRVGPFDGGQIAW
jgi:hypothetical protein